MKRGRSNDQCVRGSEPNEQLFRVGDGTLRSNARWITVWWRTRGGRHPAKVRMPLFRSCVETAIGKACEQRQPVAANVDNENQVVKYASPAPRCSGMR